MARIQCFLLEPTEKVSVKLRRYRNSSADNESHCPSDVNDGYHDVSNVIGDEPIKRDKEGYIGNGMKLAPPHDDPRWPTQCACGYVFREGDEWQRFVEEVYRRSDTGEETTIRNADAGAMWYAWWLDKMQKPQGKHCLEVKTPGGQWVIDAMASNCSMPDDRRQEKHHCWIYSGTPPNITVSKDGITCSAGAGSIQCNDYHGFLRNGFLES